jgi:hypothetical protein
MGWRPRLSRQGFHSCSPSCHRGSAPRQAQAPPRRSPLDVHSAKGTSIAIGKVPATSRRWWMQGRSRACPAGVQACPPAGRAVALRGKPAASSAAQLGSGPGLAPAGFHPSRVPRSLPSSCPHEEERGAGLRPRRPDQQACGLRGARRAPGSRASTSACAHAPARPPRSSPSPATLLRALASRKGEGVAPAPRPVLGLPPRLRPAGVPLALPPRPFAAVRLGDELRDVRRQERPGLPPARRTPSVEGLGI